MFVKYLQSNQMNSFARVGLKIALCCTVLGLIFSASKAMATFKLETLFGLPMPSPESICQSLFTQQSSLHERITLNNWISKSPDFNKVPNQIFLDRLRRLRDEALYRIKMKWYSLQELPNPIYVRQTINLTYQTMNDTRKVAQAMFLLDEQFVQYVVRFTEGIKLLISDSEQAVEDYSDVPLLNNIVFKGLLVDPTTTLQSAVEKFISDCVINEKIIAQNVQSIQQQHEVNIFILRGELRQLTVMTQYLQETLLLMHLTNGRLKEIKSGMEQFNDHLKATTRALTAREIDAALSELNRATLLLRTSAVRSRSQYYAFMVEKVRYFDQLLQGKMGSN